MDFLGLRFSKRMTESVPILAVLILCSCSLSKNLDISKQAVDQFHRQFAAAQDDTIYDAAGVDYKQSVSKENNHGFMARIRRKMGTCQVSQNTQFFTRATTSGTFVTLHYTSKCANGDLEEEFVWRIEGERAILVGYHASSPVLLTD